AFRYGTLAAIERAYPPFLFVLQRCADKRDELRVEEGHAALQDMLDPHIAPSLLQIFRDKPPMAVFGLVLAAQQASAVEKLAWNTLLDFAAAHEIEKRAFVQSPVPVLLFLPAVEDVRRGREIRFVDVIDPADFLREESQVVLFREPREL